MKSLISLLAALSMIFVGTAPSQASADYSVTQKTLSDAIGRAIELNTRQKAEIRAVVTANPNAEKFICTGIRLEGQPERMNLVVRKRAKVACEYAKTLNPQLSTWYQSKETQARSYNGRVLLTLKTPVASKSVLNGLPKNKTVAGLAAHLRSLELEASPLTPIELEYTAGPTTVPKSVELVVERFQEKLKIFQLLGLTEVDMDWVIASEKDYLWWREYRLRQNVNFPVELWDARLNELGHCRLSSDILCGAGNGLDGVKYQDNVVGTKFAGRGLDYVTRHEATHFYQSMFGYGGRCWIAEGQATLFETYLESGSRTRAEVIARLQQSGTAIANNSLAELKAKVINNSACDGDPNIAYDLGMLAMEYLYLNYSFQLVHDLQVLSSKQAWSIAVPSVLGVSADSLDSEIAAYVFAELGK